MRSKSLTYMPAIDGLRAVAVLLVFAHHALPWLHIPGGIGVDVFFVISGWLITRILLKEYRRTGSIKLGRFYLKRFLRLYPALLLLVAAVLATWFLFGLSFGTVADAALWSLTYLSNLALTFGWSRVDPLGHTWSLAMEEQFYLVWPVILIALLAMKLKTPVILGLLGVAIGASFFALATTPEIPFSPLSRAGALLVGCAAAFIVEKRPMQSTALGYASALVVVGLLAANFLNLIPYSVSMIGIILAVPLLLLHAAFGQSLLTRALSARWLVYTGVISYGIYLWHYPILKALTASASLSGSVRGVVALALTYAAAAASYHFVEKRFNAVKDRVGSRHADDGLATVGAVRRADS